MFIHQNAHDLGMCQKRKGEEGNLNLLHLGNQKEKKKSPEILATGTGVAPSGWPGQEGTGGLAWRGEHEDLLFHLYFSLQSQATPHF